MKKTLYIVILVALVVVIVVLGFNYSNSKKINTSLNVNTLPSVSNKPVVETQKQYGSFVQVAQVGNTYKYMVNNSNKIISRIIIGRADYYKGSPELATARLNWNFDTEVNPGSITQPTGWTGEVATMEEIIL